MFIECCRPITAERRRSVSRQRGRQQIGVLLFGGYFIAIRFLGSPAHYLWWTPLLLVPSALFAVIRVMIEPADPKGRPDAELQARIARARTLVWESGGEPPILPERTADDPAVEDILARFDRLNEDLRYRSSRVRALRDESDGANS